MGGPTIYPGLRRRALVAAVQAQRRGDAPPDWDTLFPADDPPVARAAINRALTSLAEAGLITGVWTTDGWLQIQVTPRGAAHAGHAGLPERSSARAPVALTTGLMRGWSAVAERVRQHPATLPLAAPAPLGDITPAPSSVAVSGDAPSRTPERPGAAGLSIVRSHLVEVWRTFTTLP